MWGVGGVGSRPPVVQPLRAGRPPCVRASSKASAAGRPTHSSTTRPHHHCAPCCAAYPQPRRGLCPGWCSPLSSCTWPGPPAPAARCALRCWPRCSSTGPEVSDLFASHGAANRTAAARPRPGCASLNAGLISQRVLRAGWFERFPDPPLGVLSRLAALLELHDPPLCAHLRSAHPGGPAPLCWTLMQDLLSSLLPQHDWLKVQCSVSVAWARGARRRPQTPGCACSCTCMRVHAAVGPLHRVRPAVPLLLHRLAAHVPQV